MDAYLKTTQRLLDEGVWVTNPRTGVRCLTIINVDLEYDLAAGEFPLVTTRKAYWKPAIAELLGYLRGYDSAAQFRAIGCNTWNANANENTSWLANPNRRGEDDMGRVYGVQGRDWKRPDGQSHDQLRKLVNNLLNGIDDRGEILTFYNPGEFDQGCLRPCMHTHQFSLLGDGLFLNSFQRSTDWALGAVFNMIQVYTLLALIARITNHTPVRAFHKMVNVHLYEGQVALMRDVQMKRTPFAPPRLEINPDIRTLDDIETWVTTDDFKVVGYEHHPAIAYPFTV